MQKMFFLEKLKQNKEYEVEHSISVLRDIKDNIKYLQDLKKSYGAANSNVGGLSALAFDDRTPVTLKYG